MEKEKTLQKFEDGVFYRKEPANAGEQEKWYISKSPDGSITIAFTTDYTLEQAVKLFKVASKLGL